MKFRSLQVQVTILFIIVLSISVGILTMLSMRNTGSSIDQAVTTFSHAIVDYSPGEALEKEQIYVGDVSVGEVLTAPIVYAYELKSQANYDNILSMIIVIIVSSFLMGYLVKRMLGPVKKLNIAIDNINEKNLSMQVEGFNSCEELGQLAQSFNTMTARLQTSFNNQKLFATSAAHELKTPLASIQTNIESLELGEQATLEEYKEIVQISKRNVQRLSQLVDQLLQINQENNCIMNEHIDALIFFKQIIKNYQTKMNEKGYTFKLNCAQIKMIGNEHLLERAFSNLFENAIKYGTLKGEFQIDVQEVNQKIKIVLSNTTEEIKPEELNQIFQPFYRIDNSRNRKNGGTGLGLAIVKSIIERHQGQIDVSYEEQRIRFTIVLNLQ